MRFKPLVVTAFLVVISFSPWDISAFAAVLAITVVASSVCFYIQLQVEYDFVFKLLHWISLSHPFASNSLIRDEPKVSHALCLNDLPKPIALKLSMFIDAIMRDFITSWYTDIGENDEAFVDEVRAVLEQVCCSAYNRLGRMDVTPIAVKLIDMFGQHVKTFNDCRLAVNRKYPDISQEDMEKCISELYETKVDLHIATQSQACELDYLKTLTDVILFVLAPKSMIHCEGGRFMLREILAIQLLKMLVDEFTDSAFLNQALIDIFEDPIPLEQLRQQWNDAYEMKTSTTNNFSGSEYDNHLSELSDSDGRLLSSREDVSCDQPESTDNTETKFATPEQSSSECSSVEYQTINQVLQQNQLEARMSAPVYGSTSVGFHSDYTPGTPGMLPSSALDSMGNVQQRPDSEIKGNPPEPCDSGITSLPKSSIPQNHMPSYAAVGPNRRHLNRTLSGSWMVCPDHSSPIFKKPSFVAMPTDQDKVSEQLKAKMRLFSGSTRDMNCCSFPQSGSYPERSLVLSGDMANYRSSDSMNGSVAISLPEGQSIYAADSEASEFDNVEPFGSSEEDKYSHASGKDGMFYDMAPQCPTCVEMHSMAGNNSVRRRKMVLQKIISEHVCGLSVPHFYQAEVGASSSGSSEGDNNDMSSFGSVENKSDIESSLATTASSGTLLASFERSLDSDCSSMCSIEEDSKATDKFLPSHPSYDVLSLAGHELAVSSVEGENCCKDNVLEDSYQPDYVIPTKRHRRRNNSIATFKSFIDSYNGDEINHKSANEASPSKSVTSVKSRKDKQVNKVKRLRKIKKSNKQREGLLGFLKSATGLGKRQHLSQFQDSDNSSADFEHLAREGNPKVRFKEQANRKVSNLTNNSDGNRGNHSDSETFFPTESPRGSMLSLEKQGNYGSLPGGINNLYPYSKPTYLQNDDDLSVEEVGDEVSEDMFEDAKPVLGLSSTSPQDSQKSDTSELHFVTNQFSAGEASDSRMEDHVVSSEIVSEKEIPIVQGEVIIRQPSQVPASAWLYPIQMISIPTHEVAFERGWEPGGNKYTLYVIHYDIRIWPDIYNKSATGGAGESTELKSVDGVAPVDAGSSAVMPDGTRDDLAMQRETLVLIREIKRRYREFIYLHNRLTHGPMAEHMKGILRPNRRYAMPFGRMDPDVIEGRRKILEYYLVSIVSRTEVCNSREFKEFLGAEGHGNVSFIKPQSVKPKLILNRQMNRIITGIRTAFPSGNKEAADKGGHLQYFIHGYDIPRMFGYGNDSSLEKHSALWLSHFVKSWLSENDNEMETDVTDSGVPDDRHVIGAVEFCQKPKMLRFHPTTKFHSSDDLTGMESFGNIGQGRHENTAIAALFAENHVASEVEASRSWMPVSVNSGSSAQWPLFNSILALGCHALRGYGSWMTFENVQQATLFGLGGLVEWLLKREINEIVIKERWLKYLTDLYEVIWDENGLREAAPPLTADQQQELKETTLERLMDFIPAVVGMTIGQPSYKLCCKNLLESIQYKRINRHLLYAALEIIMADFIPEFQEGFPTYVKHTPMKK